MRCAAPCCTTLRCAVLRGSVRLHARKARTRTPRVQQQQQQQRLCAARRVTTRRRRHQRARCSGTCARARPCTRASTSTPTHSCGSSCANGGVERCIMNIQPGTWHGYARIHYSFPQRHQPGLAFSAPKSDARDGTNGRKDGRDGWQAEGETRTK